MLVGTEAATGDIFIKKVGANKAGSFITGGDAFNQIEAGQVKPAVIAFTGVLNNAKHGVAYIGGAVKDREAEVIRGLLRGDISQNKKSILASLTRWENAIYNDMDLIITTSGLSDNQVSTIRKSFGMTPQKKRPKTFKKLR